MSIIFSEEEERVRKKVRDIKDRSGSHSPSFFTLINKIPEIKIKVDACFLSNPYATDLFLEYFKKEIISNDKIRDLLEFYPSQNAVIAEVLSDFIKVPTSNIFIGNGATEVIQAVLENFSGKKVIVNIPTFSPYYEFLPDDTEIIYNQLDKENNFKLDTDKFIDLIREKTPSAVVIINPNNPDGGYIPREELLRILDATKDLESVILDESFVHFAFENEDLGLVSNYDLVSKYSNLILIKSMSKDFGVAGIRAGYGVMSSSRVVQLLNNGYLWNSNGLAEYFFRLYTRRDFLSDYEDARKKYILGTKDFFGLLKGIVGLRVYPTKANFILVELLGGIKATDVADKLLLKYGIYVRNCDDKIGLAGSFLRVASRTERENLYIADSFREILS